MSKSHSPRPRELRRRLVEMVRAGRSPAELPEQLEPSEQCIRNGVKQAERDGGKRRDGLEGISRRRFVVTTPGERRFQAEGSNQPSVAEITYIPAWAGCLYLAIMLDVFSRRVVGWAMEGHLRTELVLAARGEACRVRVDRGLVQPAAATLVDRLPIPDGI